MIPGTLTIPPQLARQIEREGARAFPNECCGILFGRERRVDGAVERIVERLQPVANEFDSEERFHRFLITPASLLRAEKSAAAEGLVVLGFYHSHPNAPARPSEYDRAHAWPFYSYVIVSVRDGRAEDMTSWTLDEQTQTFVAQPIARCALASRSTP